jgi:hypothetical protein
MKGDVQSGRERFAGRSREWEKPHGLKGSFDLASEIRRYYLRRFRRQVGPDFRQIGLGRFG